MELPEHSLIPGRSSKIWSVVFTIGMVLNVALPLMTDPASLGIHPVAYKWVVLINAVITGLAGKIGWSWGSSKE